MGNRKQNTHAQGNKYTFSALREKVIYLNTKVSQVNKYQLACL